MTLIARNRTIHANPWKCSGLAHPERTARRLAQWFVAQNDMDAEMILGKRKHVDEGTRVARWCIMWAMRQYGFTVKTIASAMGRDHTTVLYGLVQIDNQMDNQHIMSAVAKLVEAIDDASLDAGSTD